MEFKIIIQFLAIKTATENYVKVVVTLIVQKITSEQVQ